MSATFIGHCKGCRGSVRIEAPIVRKVETKYYQRTERKYFRSLPTGQTVEGYDRFFLVCLCGKHVEFRKIVGRVTKSECNDKCMSSHGPVCDCSCGGHNHGGAYV